jgi:hypothetical protein
MNSPLAGVDPLGWDFCHCVGPNSPGNSTDPNSSFSPGGNGSGLTGFFTIAIPTATWVYGQEVPYGDYIPAHWQYGWTYTTFSFSSPSGPSPGNGIGAPNISPPCLVGAGPLKVGQSRCAPKHAPPPPAPKLIWIPTCKDVAHAGKADAVIAAAAGAVWKKYPITTPVTFPIFELFGTTSVLENLYALVGGCLY